GRREGREAGGGGAAGARGARLRLVILARADRRGPPRRGGDRGRPGESGGGAVRLAALRERVAAVRFPPRAPAVRPHRRSVPLADASVSALAGRPGGRGCDAIVVGAGPNGLAAALAVAEAGRSVLLLEAAEPVGGGARTAALTLPGFRHDVCSAIHPMGVSSPFFRRLPLVEHGLEW